MTEQIKQCRVCGDPIDHHRIPYRDCIKKAYDLPPEWPGDYKAFLLLALQHNWMDSYGGVSNMGAVTMKFAHMPDKLVTATPADDMARIILTDLVEQKPEPKPVKKESEFEISYPEQARSLFEDEGKDEEEGHTIVDEDGEQVG